MEKNELIQELDLVLRSVEEYFSGKLIEATEKLKKGEIIHQDFIEITNITDIVSGLSCRIYQIKDILEREGQDGG